MLQALQSLMGKSYNMVVVDMDFSAVCNAKTMLHYLAKLETLATEIPGEISLIGASEFELQANHHMSHHHQ